jgi:hypothetical protein
MERLKNFNTKMTTFQCYDCRIELGYNEGYPRKRHGMTRFVCKKHKDDENT